MVRNPGDAGARGDDLQGAGGARSVDAVGVPEDRLGHGRAGSQPARGSWTRTRLGRGESGEGRGDLPGVEDVHDVARGTDAGGGLLRPCGPVRAEEGEAAVFAHRGPAAVRAAPQVVVQPLRRPGKGGGGGEVERPDEPAGRPRGGPPPGRGRR
ncbi:hypothetical protein GCM10020221_12870 [Streptomyces thioluteus]|uniref:Uncharacterized protein n=1 Tax=Streptomyces thioluteus TaxID=66431 RepID=A0ABN3WKR2_STRTU